MRGALTDFDFVHGVDVGEFDVKAGINDFVNSAVALHDADVALIDGVNAEPECDDAEDESCNNCCAAKTRREVGRWRYRVGVSRWGHKPLAPLLREPLLITPVLCRARVLPTIFQRTTRFG